MKRFFAYSFLCVILSCVLGQYALFFVSLQIQKIAFREYAVTHCQASVKTISLLPHQLYQNTSTLSWLDGNKEIETNGVRYDILGSSQKNGLTNLYVLEDAQETRLITDFLKHQQHEHQNGKWLKCLSGFLLYQDSFETFTFYITPPLDFIYSSYQTPLTEGVSSPIIKPPSFLMS
jgi:hypothetical protein